MYLDQVVSGATTTNQKTTRLGQWSATGINNQTHDWFPLTDAGLVAPASVRLSGVGTLRITTTTGDCYPSYFMLVPAASITVTPKRTGTNFMLSFPTQAGLTYRVFYKTDMVNGSWALLTTLLGDGTVKSVTDPATGGRRFYKVTAP